LVPRLVAVVLIVAVLPACGSGRERSARPAAARGVAPVDAARSQDAVLAGERSVDGARAAGIRVATASQDWLYLSDEQIDVAVRALAAADSAPALAEETVAALAAARAGLAAASGPVWWLVRPLASTVPQFSPAAARVVVWAVSVLAAPGVAAPQAWWFRVALDLVWTVLGWRVRSVLNTPGPTPGLGPGDQPWPSAGFDAALVGFERTGTGAQP
jgi:hypothetical protein